MVSYEEALAIEEALPPGSYRVVADFGRVLSETEMAQIQANLVNGGIQLTGISQSGGVLSIKAIKQSPEGVGFLPALILPLLGILAIGYGIWKLPAILDSITKLVIPVGLLLLGGLVVVYAMQKKGAVK